MINYQYVSHLKFGTSAKGDGIFASIGGPVRNIADIISMFYKIFTTA